MSKIASVNALEILDSRGNPTLQVTVLTDKNIIGSASIPSGASKGTYEAFELRDENQKRYRGKGVQKAVENVLGPIAKAIIGKDIFDQSNLDRLLINLTRVSDSRIEFLFLAREKE